MAILTQVKGLNTVLTNFKIAQAKDGRTMNRVLRGAGLILQRLSQKQVPVDQGILKNSAGTRAFGSGFRTEVKVFYTAAYAIFVHENLDALHGEAYNEEYAVEIARDKAKPPGKRRFNNKGPGQKAKFLSDPMSGLPRNPQFLLLVKLEAARRAAV